LLQASRDVQSSCEMEMPGGENTEKTLEAILEGFPESGR
jgi:hypothetical protein